MNRHQNLARQIAVWAWRGFSVPEIAAKLGLSKRTVAHRLYAAGIKARRHTAGPRRSQAMAQRMLELRQKGMTYVDIGAEVGCCPATARNYVLAAEEMSVRKMAQQDCQEVSQGYWPAESA